MSAKTRAAYSHHLVDQGKRPLEYWPHTSSVIARPAVQENMTEAQTVRPPAPVCPEYDADSLRDAIKFWQDEAGHALARAADLSLLLKKLECE